MVGYVRYADDMIIAFQSEVELECPFGDFLRI